MASRLWLELKQCRDRLYVIDYMEAKRRTCSTSEVHSIRVRINTIAVQLL